ncbi:hypothetical protein BHE74_00046323, partial [Ensete ventricosum]
AIPKGRAIHARERQCLLATALVAGNCPLRGGRVRLALKGPAVACCPYRWPGRGRPPLIAAFTAKTQQECVEQFYVSQSDHM